MKKAFLLFCSLAALTAPSAFATISFVATPSSQSVAAGGNFNVTFSLNVTQSSNPANVAGFDLLLETAAANSGFFSITGATTNVSGWNTPAGAGTYPDAFTTANSSHSGFAQNSQDQGFVGTLSSAHSTPISNLSLETLALSIAPNTPAGTYTFFTTDSSTSGARGSSVNDSNGNSFFVDTPGSFSITVVPEPGTWSLLAFGGISSFALSIRGSRRKS